MANNGSGKAGVSSGEQAGGRGRTGRSQGTATLPLKLAPPTAIAVDAPPQGDWSYEMKLEGYRLLARVGGGDVRLFNRKGQDWTDRFPQQVKALRALRLNDAWLDGELVLLGADGSPNVSSLRQAMEKGDCTQAIYYLFDAPFLEGQDARHQPLEARRAALKKCLARSRSRALRFSEAFTAGHQDILESAQALSIERVVGKRRGSTYGSGRCEDWVHLSSMPGDKPLRPRGGRRAAVASGTAGSASGTSRGKVLVEGVGVSHPERLIDAQSGTHKVDVAQFYASIADWLLPQLDQRPVSLVRCPEGIDGEHFFQRHAERLNIPHIRQLDRQLDPGHARLMEIDSTPALIGAAQMGALELHTWGATSDQIERPDRLILDLDPDTALPWSSVIAATQEVLGLLERLGLSAFLKTSGGRGMHVVVPLARHAGWEQVKGFAKALAEYLARHDPQRFSATMGEQNRIGKVFVDYLRNSRGGSTVAAYSLRARPGLPVSVPIARAELAGIASPTQWHIGNLKSRLLKLKADPWQEYRNRQRLSRAMWAALEADPSGN